MVPVDGKYKLKENVVYSMYISQEYLDTIKTQSKFLYLHSHMPRIHAVAKICLIRRTAFIQY